MARAGVATESLAGGDRVHLGTLGRIDGLQWSHTLPGGPEHCSFNFHRDARYNHRGLELGRKIQVYVGGDRAWAGLVTDPGRGNPWQIRADGYAVLVANMRSDGTTGNPFNLNEIWDGAIGRGLPLGTRPTLPSGTSDLTSLGNGGRRPSLAEALSRVLPESGYTWYVDNHSNLQLVSALTQPTHLLLTADPGGGRTVSGHTSAYHVHYHDSSTGKHTTMFVRNAALEGKALPIIERVLDLTHRGAITAAVAAAIAQARLLLFTGTRMPWASSFTFGKGMVRTLSGSVIDPATVRPPMLARMLLTDPDHPAETNYASVTDMLVGRTTYFDDTNTVQVEPFDFEGVTFKSLLKSAARVRHRWAA